MKEINITLNNLDNQKWKNQVLNNLKQDIINELKSSNINKANINIYTTSRKQDLVNIKENNNSNPTIKILLTSNLDVKFIMEALAKVDDICNIDKDTAFLTKRIIHVLKSKQKEIV